MITRRKVIAWVVSFCLGVAICAVVFAEPIPLQDAVRQGKVSVEVKSLGGATGNTVRVGVQKKVPGKVEVAVTPGTVFVAKSGKPQNMAGGKVKGKFTQGNKYRPTSVMVLVDNNKHSYLVESYCLDYSKPAPKRDEAFTLAVADQRAKRILKAGEGNSAKPTVWANQAAIWMDRSGVSPEEAQRRSNGRITSVDVKVAKQLLASAEKSAVAEIPDGIAADVKVEIAGLFSSDPAVREKAVTNLKEMGVRAAPAIPFLLKNVIRSGADGRLPSAVVQVYASPTDTAVAVEQLDLPALAELVRQRRAKRTAEQQEPQSARTFLGGRLIGRRVARLKDDNPHIRQRAATTLGLMKDPRAVEPLIDTLRDKDPQVQQNAAEALKNITGQDLGTSKLRWSNWWRQNKNTVLR